MIADKSPSIIRRTVSIGVLFGFVARLVGPAQAQIPSGFELRAGDHVALVGDTLIEREQSYGYVEERLTVRYPTNDIQFRNLGWSADTPAGNSRASFDFDKPGKGYEQLTNQIAQVQPTVVIIGYGMANSFAGEAGLAQFKKDLNKLVDGIQEVCTNKPVRLVFLSPARHENLGPPLPDPAPHNAQLALYTAAISEIAAARNSPFVSLYKDVGSDTNVSPAHPLTDNGIHYTAFGYSRVADALEKSFGWQPNSSLVRITAGGQISPGSSGTSVDNVERSGNRVRFSSLDEQLVEPLPADASLTAMGRPCVLQVDELKPGHYELRIDGIPVVTGTAAEWGQGVAYDSGPQFDQAEKLRQAILKKNELYFNRWRPQNQTYLFGFRKYEQGQNAKEIPMFDDLIREQETLIAKLRQPVRHSFELVAAKSHRKAIAATAKPKSGAAAFPEPKTEQPVPNFEVAPGFKVSLYAETPLLAKPTQMNFDPRGRLWVVSSSVYPQIAPGQTPEDKVLILEDTKGAGKVDKSTVFADGLMIPTGVEPGDGGAYVGQGTQLLHFKDTKGTGVADEKRIVLSGFGTEDTHHIVHTLQWGPDGQLYFDQSIYIHSHFETPHGVEELNSGGIWHLRPPTMELGVFLRGFCNPWGHQFDAFGQSFVTDGAGGQGLSWGITDATYFTYAEMRRELPSVSPGSYPKFCALEIIRSRQFPDDWQGNAITCDFRAHRVVRFAIEEKGAGYVTKEMPDLLRSTNVTFRPIDVKLGPDGALYIADWANPIIQHGEVDFRDPRRDHEHGRIWRIVADKRPLLKRPKLINASNQQLFHELLSPNAYNQQQARRVLTERGAAITNDLARWTKTQKTESALLQALWMYQSVDVVEPALLEKLLNAGDAHVRAAATRVVSYWHPRLAQPLDLLAARVADSDLRVRVEAMRALAEIPDTRSPELVLGSLSKTNDPFVDYAAWLSINDLAEIWVKAYQSGAWKADGRDQQLEFALKAIQPNQAGVVLSQVLQTREIPRDGSGAWIELIGSAGGETELRELFEKATGGGLNDDATVRALTALTEAARSRSAGISNDVTSLAQLFKNPNQKIAEGALHLAGAWKRDEAVAPIIALINDSTAKAPVKKTALTSLGEIGGAPAKAELTRLAKESSDTTLQREATLSLTTLDPKEAKQPLLDTLNGLKDAKQAAEFWQALLRIKGVPEMLVKALPKTGLSPIMAKSGITALRESGRNEPELSLALSQGADLESQGLGLTDAEMKQIAGRVAKSGDAARGENIFRRNEIGCVNCHAIGGAGGKVGPDLTSIGASAPVDYLIESVFYPNRKIKDGYQSVLVETTDGEEVSGNLVRENSEELVLRDATGKETSTAKKNIKSRKPGNSLMPSGLVDSLSSAQQLDLFRFLSELGKPGDYDASKGNVARSWKLIPQTLEIAQFGDDKIVEGSLTNAGWTTSYSQVDGRLLKKEFDASLAPVASRSPTAVYAAACVQTSGGPLAYKLSGCPAQTPVWIDGKPSGGSPAAKFPSGEHTIIVKLDANKLPEFIRLEVTDGTFLAK